MSLKFQRNIEDFTCENCSYQVKGTGYTNHCPKCLYSKHVDVNPGDRAELCGGLMKPVQLIMKKGKYSIVHLCMKCGEERVNKAAPDDDVGALLG